MWHYNQGVFPLENKHYSTNLKGNTFHKLERHMWWKYKVVKIHYFCVSSSVKQKGELIMHQDTHCPTALEGAVKLSAAIFRIQPLHGTSTMLRIQFSWIKCRWAQEIQVMTKSSCFFWRKAHNLSLSVIYMNCPCQSCLCCAYLNHGCWVLKLCRGALLFLLDKLSGFHHSL